MTLAEITKSLLRGVKKAVNMLHSMDNAQAISPPAGISTSWNPMPTA